MALRLVTGGANAGKTGALHALLLQAAARGLPAVLLVPSKPEADRAARELARARAAGIAVSTFDSYLDGLWGLLGDGRQIVGEAQRTVLLSRATSETRTDALGASALRPGFASVADLLVRRAGESGGLAGDRASRIPRPGVAHDLAAIVDSYGLHLRKRGLIERTEAHRALGDLIVRGDLPGTMAINRFSSFTEPQERFVYAAAASGVDVAVALTYETDHPATRSAEGLVRRLEAIASSETQQVAGEHTPSEEIAHLERNLFRTCPVPKRGSDGDVVISTAEGLVGEAQRIIREIQELAESGTRADEIAVVFRNPRPHERALRRAFAEAGIAAYFDVPRPVSQTGLGRALSLLLAFSAQGMQRKHLVGFLRSGYSWASPDSADELDRLLRANRVERGPGVLDVARRLEDKARKLLELGRRLSSQEITPSRVDDWKRLLDTMLVSAYPGARALDDAGLLDAAARRAIVEMIEELSVEAGAARASEITRLLDDLSVTASGSADDVVQVMSAERARSRRFSAVILGGLTAGEFPLSSPEDALNSGGVAEELGQAGIDVAPRTDLDAERLLFYQVVTGARRRLIVSYTVCDDDGRPVRESQFIHELKDVYRDPVTGEGYGPQPPERRLTLADLTEAPDAPSTARRQLRMMAEQGAELPAVARALRRRAGRRPCLSQEVLGALASRAVFSVSEIEGYLACPYKWFYQNHLRPEPLDDPIDARTRGSLAHDILSRFYAEWTATQHERVTQETLKDALQLHDRVADEVLTEASAPAGLEEEQQHHAARRGSRRIIVRDAVFLPGFAPIAHEYAFGVGEDPAEDMGEFSLRGRIDRIDASATGLVVSDYKTSGVYKRADFERDGIVQIPLYAEVVHRRFGREIVAGFYRSMGNQGDRGFLLDTLAGTQFTKTDRCTAGEIEDIVDSAIARATVAVDGIRNGRIPAEPLKSKTCDHCSARSLCERSGR
ncbi:MAG: PD-(D/E)XK nuclease family protein [Coriobacteriia bacterium]